MTSAEFAAYQDFVSRIGAAHEARVSLFHDESDALRMIAAYRGHSNYVLIDNLALERLDIRSALELIKAELDRLIDRVRAAYQKAGPRHTTDDIEMRIRPYPVARPYSGTFIIDDPKPKKEPLPPEWGEEAP